MKKKMKYLNLKKNIQKILFIFILVQKSTIDKNITHLQICG